jgi:hypothetical protein
MLLLQVSKAHFPNTQLGCATLFPPCKKTAVGSDFEDAEIAGLQNSERLKGKFYKETLRPKTEEKKKKNQTTSTMGMYVNYAII